jgi:anti-sigma B factor antagonist
VEQDLSDLRFVPATLEVERDGDARVSTVTLRGEIDLRAHNTLRHLLWTEIDAGCNLIVDLTAVDFLDSTAIGLLVGALKRARERLPDTRQPHVVLVVRPGEVLRTFALTGLDRVFALTESLEDARSVI